MPSGPGGRGRGRGGGRGGNSGGRGGGGICFQYQNTGKCRFGNRCKFRHVGGTSQSSSSSSLRGSNPGSSRVISTQAKKNEDSTRFIAHLSQVASSKLSTELVTKSVLWKRCWEDHKALDDKTGRMMLEVLARTPGSSSIDPPRMQLVEEVVDKFLEQSCVKNNASDDAILTAVKTVLDAVIRLLQFEWDCARDEVTEALSNIIELAEGKLKKRQQDHRDVAARLVDVLEDLEKPWRIKLKELPAFGVGVVDSAVDETAPQSYDDWKTANIQWLCNPKFFSPSSCPKMLVGESGVYESPEHYFNTTHRLWVAMTFSDGHAALAPRCRSRTPSGVVCSNVLWPMSSNATNSDFRCRTSGCSRPVEFCCRTKSHDALCDECASRSVARHLGPPGQGTSTHIYDCKVKHVDSDGILYLVGFKSRNPPPNAVHWRSTKRLSPPNLVAIVRTRVKGAALLESDKIKWGEVVYHGHNRDEERRRQNGDLAINVSSIEDFDPDEFEEGSFVAVIDCMTFVPEWIPVLKAMESLQGSRLPFENGRLLNLGALASRFDSLADGTDSFDIANRSRTAVIETMVANSRLEPIREVRRDETLREELISRLDSLVVSTTLDEKQFMSFLEALTHPVHLTQGPPGTGKSYFGVVLCRALMIIRDLWVQKSNSVVSPPILVLSYKNMAINHFLVDLVKSAPGLSAGNKLIRIGGQCSDSRLARFSERTAFHSDAEVKTARFFVDKLYTLRDSIRSTLFGNVASFLSFRAMIFENGDDQTRRKAANKATDILMEGIVMRHLLAAASEDESHGVSPSDIVKKLYFLENDGNGRSSKQLTRLVMAEKGTDYIVKLEDDFAQSKQAHWGDLVLMWLCGKKPLPDCQFVDEDQNLCVAISLSHDVRLCDKHRCHFVDTGRCQAQACNQGWYCESHCCCAKSCRSSILRAEQQFCVLHSCKKCIELGVVAKLSTAKPPRNVCSDHPMCTFPSCLDYCTDNGIYCRAHHVVKCSATTKKGNPCKGQPVSRYKPFCRDHLHLASTLAFETNSIDSDDSNSSVSSSSSVPPMPIQKETSPCIALTKKGRQCKGTALSGAKYCYDHAPPEASKVSMQVMVGESVPVAEKLPANKLELSAQVAQATPTLEDDEGTPRLASDGVAEIIPCLEIKNLGADDNSSLVSSQTLDEEVDATAPDGKLPVDQDEVEVEDDEGENLKHLRDVFDVNASVESDDEASSGTNEYDEFEDAVGDIDPDNSSSLKACDPNEWTWEMTLEERWLACHQLMEELQALLTQTGRSVGHALSIARNDLRQAKIRAKARLYENKSIIGGTMVGCISRLESIKTARPFAVICEEASEVLEPLLFSCLSESTLKLEMVGDHRQLQPSVMSRYDFEIYNKVNVSMFQRLIEAPLGHEIPNCVLSVQRRMRKNICDLTRNYYMDVIEIEDHETCALQVIGQRSSTSAIAVQSSLTGGREVPGILPHLFMWTHKGEQKKSAVGLSRINQDEATMACCLAAYLVECGVPRSSICILTPYKGQLMLIRNMLFKDNKFRHLHLISRDPDDDDVCRVSTVDRFQGDEEDIIIASLVVDAHSKTGFVKLINRMIVLLSRARLGFYLLANSGFLGNSSIPEHWRKTLQILELPGESDSPGVSTALPSLPRCGSELPLCCPVHREITMLADSASKIRMGFCTELCNELLSCGHECCLRCHWPKNVHNSRCSKQLESPCTRHSRKIECWEAYKNAKGAPFGTQHENVMLYYKCPANVELILPCDHTVIIPCWEEKEIIDGQRSWPVCTLPSPKPFVFSRCGHTRDNVTCLELAKFSAAPDSVRCTAPGLYQANCGHKKNMECWEVASYASCSKIYDCRQVVEETLPRCGHKQKLLCPIATKLAGWTGQSCVEVGVVLEGTTYGPSDHTCKEKSTLARKCGHNLQLSCSEAFSRVISLQPCHKKVRALHPLCGHECRIPCCDLAKVKKATVPDPVEEYVEGKIPPRSVVNIDVQRCSKHVQIKRECGHAIKIICSDVGKPLIRCKEVVKRISPLCGHEIYLPCYAVREFQKDAWSPTTFSALYTGGRIGHDARLQRDLDGIDPEILNALASCGGSRTVDLACGHEKIIACSDLLTWATDRDNSIFDCSEPSSLELPCGHQTESICSQATKVKAGCKPSIECSASMRQVCWNHAICGRKHTVRCGFRGVVACGDSVRWTCSKGIHSFDVDLCSSGSPKSCPGCSMDDLDAMIRNPLAISAPDLANHLKALPIECVTALTENKKRVAAREKELFSRYKAYLVSLPEWKRPLVDCKRVPCYRVLTKRNRMIDRFDPSVFVRSTSMHGIIAKTLTKANLLQLAAATNEEDSFTLLIGYAAIARTHVRTSPSLPTNKKKASMLQRIFQDEYDSMLYREKGMEALVVWDPFPMVATHRLKLGKEQILQLASRLEDAQVIDLLPRFPEFEPPPSGFVKMTKNTNDCLDENALNCDSDAESDEEKANEFSSDIADGFRGTIFDGYDVDCDWPGGIESKGQLTSIDEIELLEKMQFVNRSSPPFAALQRLRKLIAKKEDSSILHMLLAAELSVHDPKRAKEELRSYMTVLEKSICKYVHPWGIIVAARLYPEHNVQLLSLFTQIFPRQNNLLSSDEIQMIEGNKADEEKSKDWSEILKEEWHELQTKYPAETHSEDMDTLLGLIGLRKVKTEALSLWKSALQLRKLSAEKRKENLITSNYVFLGNPGSGKTSVARLFASILCQSGIREKDVCVELTAQQAKDGGTDEFQKSTDKALGGVIFIDEAYDLDPINDPLGKPIVNELLTLCENKRDKISVILAGYEDDFEKKFFAYNDGLKSRFRSVVFEDFDEDELTTIWNDMREKKGWKEKDGVTRVAVKRMVKMAGRKGFGNAREVRKRLEDATKAAMSRLGSDFTEDAMIIEIEDVIGHDPRLANKKLINIRNEIDAMIGWGRVKKQVNELIKLCGTNYQRELLGQPPLDIFLNRMFLGNPGTGKTTCAKLYGALLKELGFLTNGQVITKTASDFIGRYVGQSQTKTSQILESAKGKVLIIDEAYALDDGLFGKQVLDTIVEKVHGAPNEDIAVLLLGYEEQMLKMITGRHQNPGLARRFPKEQAFYFDDYDDNELLEIILFYLKKNEVKASIEFREKALDVLRVQRAQTNFGNAGSAELVVKGALVKAAERLSPDYSELVLEASDIDEPGSARAEKDSDPLSLVDGLYRMEKVKAKLDKMRKSWEVSKQDGDEQPKLGHFVFTGSPGTGKTTVARTIAKILYGLALLPTDKIVETSALDLQAKYLGQTSAKVNETLDDAKGGVLFIDEAYNLGLGQFGKEACDAIVAAMTSDSYRDVVIVIAGYAHEIHSMLDANIGLKSRFTHFFEFPDWTTSDCASFFEMLAKKNKFMLADGAADALETGCAQIMAFDGWGNGRDVTRLWEESKSNRDERVYTSKETEKTIIVSDVQEAVKSMLSARQPKPAPSTTSHTQSQLFSDLNAAFDFEDSNAPKKETDTAEALDRASTCKHDGKNDKDGVVVDEDSSMEAESTGEGELPPTDTEPTEKDAPCDGTRDDGVPDEVWDELCQAKEQERAREEELRRQQEEHEHFLKQQREEEAKARSAHELELERIQKRLAQEEQERAVRAAQEAERKRKEKEDLKRRQREAELQRIEEEKRKRAEIQRRLRLISPCPMGYQWFEVGGGWRCGGGSHYVSDAELQKQFTFDHFS